MQPVVPRGAVRSDRESYLQVLSAAPTATVPDPLRSRIIMLRCCFGGQPTSRADRTASSGNCNLSDGAIVIDDEDWSYSYTLKIAGYSRTKELLETGKYARSTPFTVGGHVWAVR